MLFQLFSALEKKQKTAIREQRQRLDGELINSILKLSIYCVKFWNSMEKSWHHFQPIPGQEVYNVKSRSFYPPLLNSPWQTLTVNTLSLDQLLRCFCYLSATNTVINISERSSETWILRWAGGESKVCNEQTKDKVTSQSLN